MAIRFLIVVAVAALVSGCKSSTPTSPSPNVAYSQTDLRVGTGTEATTGRSVTVNYSLWLYDASAAENKGRAVEAGQFGFVVGSGVIPGFSQAVNGMRVGGQRRAIIPPSLAYGSAGNPPQIPPNTTLVFEIELLSVQ